MQDNGKECNGLAMEESVCCIPQEVGVLKKLTGESGDTSSPSNEESIDKNPSAVLSIVISCSDACDQPSIVPECKGNINKISRSETDEKTDASDLRKGCLSRSESFVEECRICQQQTEESLLDLGCQCRGELAKAHQSCIEVWFRTRGSNKCEICRHVTANVPPPEPNQNGRYWTWRAQPAFGGSTFVQPERERGCFSPLWIAFSILIGGLLLDVLISISLGVSTLPINIIIGVLVVLGLGTALRLALECCYEWNLRREVRRVDTIITPGYHPAL